MLYKARIFGKKMLAFLLVTVFIMSIFTVNISATTNTSRVLSSDDNTVVVSSNLATNADNDWNNSLQEKLNKAYKAMNENKGLDLFYTMASVSGKNVNTKEVNNYISSVALSEQKDILQSSIDIINVSFCGYNASNLLGNNLVSKILAYDNFDNATTNELCYALIALDTLPYKTLEGGKNTRHSLVQTLFARQNDDGSFSIKEGERGSTIQTAMVLTALASYSKFDTQVSAVTNLALKYIKTQIHSNGACAERGMVSLEATAKTIVALEALGKSISSDEFSSNGKTLIDGLLLFETPDGFFAENTMLIPSDSATLNAILALSAIKKEKSIFIIHDTITTYVSYTIKTNQLTEEHKNIIDEQTSNTQSVEPQTPKPTVSNAEKLLGIETLMSDITNLSKNLSTNDTFKYLIIAIIGLITIFVVLKNESRHPK